MAQLQSTWAAQLDPLLRLPLSSSVLLKSVVLGAGGNVVNHRLGRKLQGWIITRLRGASSIYDTQDTNSTPELTLTLNASAPVTVDLIVF